MNGIAPYKSDKPQDLQFIKSQVMNDGAIALMVRYKDEYIVTRMYLTQLVGFLHNNHFKDALIDNDLNINMKEKVKFKMEINTPDYYVISENELKNSQWYQNIPEYKNEGLIEAHTTNGE